MTDVNHDTALGLKSGEMLAQYRIEQPIGRGGQGTVWKAYDTKLDRMVAIKQVPPVQASDPEYVGAFRQECRLLARIGPKCPHIVAIFDFIEDETGLYSVMEFVDGQTLDAMLGAEQLSDRDKVEVLGQLLQGLHEVHSAGIIHRDIKPQNILLEPAPGTPGFHLRLTDFGVAGTVGGAGAVPMGTTKYMAPENFRGGPVDARVDLYAAGFVAYEMFGGRAFEKAFDDILSDQRNEHLRWMQWHSGGKQAPPAANLRPSVPEVRMVSPVLAKLTAKDPDARYASAAEALADLKTTARSGAAAVEAPAPPPAGFAGAGAPARPPASSNKPPPPPPARLAVSARSDPPAKTTVPHDERTDTKRLPTLPPWYARPAYIAAAVGGLAALVLIVLSLSRKDPIAELRLQAKESFKNDKWSESAARHRELAEALRGDGRNPDEAKAAEAIAELCDAYNIVAQDPERAIALARKAGAVFDELKADGLRNRVSALENRTRPTLEFADALSAAVTALAGRDRGRAATQIAAMQQLNEKHRIGKERILAVMNRVRLAYDTGATNTQSLDRVTGALSNGELTGSLETELGDVAGRFQSLIATCEELRAELTNHAVMLPLLPDIARIQDEAKERKGHADSVLDFHKIVKATRPWRSKAVNDTVELKTKKVTKGNPATLFGQAKPLYERADSIAKVMTDKRLPGIPPALIDEARSSVQLCDDGLLYLGLIPIHNEKTGVTTSTDENLEKYAKALSRMRDNGNLDRLGAAWLLNAVESEQSKRAAIALKGDLEKKFGDLERDAAAARLAGQYEKELACYKAMMEIPGAKIPFNLDNRNKQLIKALVIKPRVEEQAKALTGALADMTKAVSDPTRVVLPGPGAGEPAVKVADLIDAADEVCRKAETDINDARGLGVFDSDQAFKDVLAPAVRDYDALLKLLRLLKELDAEIADFNRTMKEAENQKTDPGRSQIFAKAKDVALKIGRPGAGVAGSGAEIRRRVGGHLENLAEYAISRIKIARYLNAGRGAQQQALKTSGQERERWFNVAQTNVNEAQKLFKDLRFPLDADLQSRLAEIAKDLPKAAGAGGPGGGN